MPEPKTHPFVVELARDQQTVTEILRTHFADENGKCAGCHLDDKLRKPWPCVLHRSAEQARDLIERAEQRAALRSA